MIILLNADIWVRTHSEFLSLRVLIRTITLYLTLIRDNRLVLMVWLKGIYSGILLIKLIAKWLEIISLLIRYINSDSIIPTNKIAEVIKSLIFENPNSSLKHIASMLNIINKNISIPEIREFVIFFV